MGRGSGKPDLQVLQREPRSTQPPRSVGCGWVPIASQQPFSGVWQRKIDSLRLKHVVGRRELASERLLVLCT